ncbi:MAG: type II secretion system F family protein [Paludibacterium sp.]|uniref:type II secretion system F family protein n=1 Tax=Paludibacterium sp. TaxID=1917523 RepID=UPI0025DEBC7C|nr:type II secretion system F family protein [Paludibacterium sp.]MBV8046645.1 type II secretion system F family protein [Paludibacterium sp.]
MTNVWTLGGLAMAGAGCFAYGMSQWRGAGGMAAKLEARLQALCARPAPGSAMETIARHDPNRWSPWSRRLLAWFPRLEGWNKRLRQSGSAWPVSRLIGAALAAGLAGALLAAGVGAMAWSWPLAALAAGMLPFCWVGQRARRQANRFDAQLPEALALISRSLRAGMTLPATLAMVGDEFAAPLGPHFRQLSDELGYGAAFGEALDHLAANAPSEVLRYVISAMAVQREVGGNLAELTANVAEVMRLRLRMNDKVRALTAEGRLSAVLLTALPLGMLALLAVLNRDYVSVFWTDETGRMLLAAMLVMVMLGNLMMRRMARIRY